MAVVMTVDEKTRENRLRRIASRKGVRLVKLREVDGVGGTYMIVENGNPPVVLDTMDAVEAALCGVVFKSAPTLAGVEAIHAKMKVPVS